MTTAKDVIRLSLDLSDYVVNAYLEDLTDADLLIAPVEGMNSIAWQLGHVISGECYFANIAQPGASPALPEGFDAAHSKETATPNAFKPVYTKADYLAFWKAQRAATLAALDALPEERLDAETGISYAPTVAAVLNMIGAHALGHFGQFVAVRRKLGKPVKF